MSKAISDLEDSMKQWVNEQLTGYYTIAETDAKNSYSWDNYKWCAGDENSQTKYCNESTYGKAGNKVQGKKDGYSERFVFLPAAGGKINTILLNKDTGGYY